MLQNFSRTPHNIKIENNVSLFAISKSAVPACKPQRVYASKSNAVQGQQHILTKL
jgi:hypothetical protein